MTERWRSVLDHPIVRLELRRIRRKRWWPGRRFFLFYPVLLGAVLGCGVALALSDSLEKLSVPVSGASLQLAALVTGVPAVCLVSVVTSLLSFALPWIAPALTAATIARERELGTFDLLRVTLLTERSIVLGKLGGCLAWLWPGILTLALLTPFQVVLGAGIGLFGSSSYLPVLMTDSISDAEGLWVWLLLMGVAGLLKPWGDLALHAALGIFVSVLARSSGTAIVVSYSAILVVRVFLWLVTSILGPLLLTLLVDATQSLMDMAPTGMVVVSSLPLLAAVFIEIAGAALLVWGAICWLKR